MTEREHSVFSPEETAPRHNCGIIGVSYTTPPENLAVPVYALSKIQHRGQEGSGFVKVLADGQTEQYRTPDLLRDVVDEDGFKQFVICDVEKEDVSAVVMHNRYSTSGSLFAGQPFVDENLITAHNGTLTNPRDLFSFIPEEMHDSVQSDTHALHLALEHGSGTLEENIENILPEVEGAYSLILSDPTTQSLYGIRDPRGFRPLEIGKLKDGSGYMLASEDIAFYQIADKVRSVRPGEGIKIQDGKIETFFHDPRCHEQSFCLFELAYFSHPLSKVEGAKVNQFRRACGADLAAQDKKNGFKPDLVIPVMDSGLSGGIGYGEEIGVSANEEAMLKDKYNSGRSFIAPGDRGKIVEGKFIIDEDEVKGKSIVLVDDSLVRGTTMKRIVSNMKEFGAKEVHVRILFPPVRHACYMGIDFADENELVGNGRTVEEICDFIDADSLVYIDREQQIKIAKEHSCEENLSFCDACVSGNYPLRIDKRKMLRKN